MIQYIAVKEIIMCKFLALRRSELGLFSVLGKQLSTMERTLLGKWQPFDVHTHHLLFSDYGGYSNENQLKEKEKF